MPLKLTGPTTIDYVHRKVHPDGTGEFALVKLVFSPTPAGTGLTFRNLVTGDWLPAQLVAATEKGLRAVIDPGIDLEVALIDAQYHDIDSNPRTFEIAARGAVYKLNEK